MATLATMYAAQANSPGTETASALDATATSVLVQDASVLPAAPFLLTLGYDKNESETVTVTAKNGNTLTIIRGVDGPASIWIIGTKCARTLTAKDINDMQSNIRTLNSSKEEAGTAAAAISTHDDNSDAHSTAFGGKADKVSGATNNNFAALDANGNLKDSGHKHGDYLTAHQDISGKADKVSNPTSGNFAALDSNGNLTDSGHKHGDYLTTHQDISGKADKVSSATNGHLAGLDSNGNLTDSGYQPSDFIASSKKGTANGVPQLDSYGKVNAAQTSARIVSKSANYTLQSSDAGCLLAVTGTTTITIPSTLPVGTEIEILNYGTGIITVAAASGVTLNGTSAGSKQITEQYTSAVMKAITATAWVIQGAIE